MIVQHYIGYLSHYIHYIHTFIVHTKEREESGFGYRDTWNSTTATLVFYVPGVQLRYTGSPFYVPIRRTMMNTMDIYMYMYNAKINDMTWEPAPGI